MSAKRPPPSSRKTAGVWRNTSKRWGCNPFFCRCKSSFHAFGAVNSRFPLDFEQIIGYTESVIPHAGVVELADARDSKSRVRKDVRVRPPPPAPNVKNPNPASVHCGRRVRILLFRGILFAAASPRRLRLYAPNGFIGRRCDPRGRRNHPPARQGRSRWPRARQAL